MISTYLSIAPAEPGSRGLQKPLPVTCVSSALSTEQVFHGYLNKWMDGWTDGRMMNE